MTAAGTSTTRSSLESAEAVIDTRRRLTKALGSNFRVDDLVGRGGFAEVFAVHDLRLKRDLAVKVLSPELVVNQAMLTRFRREAEAVAALRHPGIVPIYDVGEAGGIAYIVMPLIKGVTLRKKLEDEGRFEIRQARRILRDVAEALRVAHEAGLVHRDIKPENVMLDGPKEQVLVMDFGIAKAIDPNASGVTTAGLIVGTPHYMSPEQASGEMVDARSDQYSLAVMGYRMVTGTHPFEAETTRALLYKQVFETPPPAADRAPDVPLDLSDALQRGMAKEPADRYPTIEAFSAAVLTPRPDTASQPIATAADVATSAEDRPGPDTHTAGAPPPSAGAGPTKPARGGRPGRIVAGGVTMVVVLAGLFWARSAFFSGSPAVVDSVLTSADTAAPTDADRGTKTPQAPANRPTTPSDRRAGSPQAPARAASGQTPAVATLATCTAAVRASAWDQAVLLCRTEADGGSAEAKVALAGMYLAGRGAGVDAAAAAELYQQAANAGSADAALRLGQMLETGDGVPSDPVRASQLYTTAARRGVVPAMRWLAGMLESGKGIAKNESEAVDWYRRAAAAGDAQSILRIGQMYSLGIGVARDEVTAARYFARGADAGMADAQYELARAYFAGRGVPRSDSLGVVWLERAAARGSTAAADDLKRWRP
jgi:serine/threonine-protein kinase